MSSLCEIKPSLSDYLFLLNPLTDEADYNYCILKDMVVGMGTEILMNDHVLVFCVPEAFQHVRDNMQELNGAGAKETDLLFLRHLLDSPVVKGLVQVTQTTPH